MNILIVDDETSSLDILSDLLGFEGHRTMTLQDPRKVLESTQSFAADVLFLDIHMPRMNGYDVFKLLQKHPDTQQLPVVFISALDEEGNRKHIHRLGAKHFLSKPFNIADVLELVRSFAQPPS